MTQESTDAYAAFDRDVSSRLMHLETRIKYWVIAGVVTNLLALIGLGIPLVYYLGTLNAQTSAAISTVNITSASINSLTERVTRLEAKIDNWQDREHSTWGTSIRP